MHAEVCIVCYMLAWNIYSFVAYLAYVNIVLSLFSQKPGYELMDLKPDLLEMRLDGWVGDSLRFIRENKKHGAFQTIITVRSEQEGGLFKGNSGEWETLVNPLLPYTDYVDIEQNYSNFAPGIRATGKKVIASCHSHSMIHAPELMALESNLRKYGDIPKIIVTPDCHEDIFELSEYLLSSTLPLCLGVMGEKFRYARALFALFGSYFVYCHGGDETAKGQYSIGEMKEILGLLQR